MSSLFATDPGDIVLWLLSIVILAGCLRGIHGLFKLASIEQFQPIQTLTAPGPAMPVIDLEASWDESDIEHRF